MATSYFSSSKERKVKLPPSIEKQLGIIYNEYFMPRLGFRGRQQLAILGEAAAFKLLRRFQNLSDYIVTETNLLKQIRKLKCDIQDMSVETSVREDVHNCILKELMGKIKWSVEESNMKFEDSYMESVNMQEICGTIFREAAKDTERRLYLMKMKYEGQSERLISLEASVLESEKALNSVTEEKEQLQQELVKISALLEEKEKVALETGSMLVKEKERADQIYQDLSSFKDQAIQQEKLVSVTKRESDMIKSKLEDKIAKSEKTLKLTIEDLQGANIEMKRLQVIIEQKENALSLVVARESGQKKQVESLSTYVERLIKTVADFEGQTMEILEKNNLRLKRLKFQCDALVQNDALSRKTELVYKQRLERRYADLQKAEAEVDRLGDEVDALRSLHEKIYIGLNHYSPILQHYPGIMEILKLIKRELSGESCKAIHHDVKDLGMVEIPQLKMQKAKECSKQSDEADNSTYHLPQLEVETDCKNVSSFLEKGQGNIS